MSTKPTHRVGALQELLIDAVRVGDLLLVVGTLGTVASALGALLGHLPEVPG